jgi:hypothetical protein
MAGVKVEVRQGGEEAVSAPAQVSLKRGPQRDEEMLVQNSTDAAGVVQRVLRYTGCIADRSQGCDKWSDWSCEGWRDGSTSPSL